MYEDLKQGYEYMKKQIDKHFYEAYKKNPENKEESLVECAYCIGRAYSFALIMQAYFNEDLRDDMWCMRQIKEIIKGVMSGYFD